MSKLSNYENFLFYKKNEGIVSETEEGTLNSYIDEAYKFFKELGKPINTKDIIEHVEQSIGKELDDDDYSELYYKITGEYIDDDEIEDLDDEEKFIIK
jgi:hypothetical protein